MDGRGERERERERDRDIGRERERGREGEREAGREVHYRLMWAYATPVRHPKRYNKALCSSGAKPSASAPLTATQRPRETS